MTSSIDIVILSWGRVADTCAAIDSALSQRGVAANVIVIDQGTTEQELLELKKHIDGNPRVELVCNNQNRGVPGGRNQGSALGNSDFIVALDNDAEFASEHELSRAVLHMEADNAIAALAFRIVLFANGDDDRTSWPYPYPMKDNAGRTFPASRFVGAGHMIRRSYFDRVGGYDEALIFLHEEVDLSYRLINAGGVIVYEPSIRVRHKVAPENRVSWSGKRYYFHIRNTVYMSAKYNFPVASSLLNVTLALVRGLRSGFFKGTVLGFLSGLTLVPRGIWLRLFNKGVRLSREAKRRIKATSPTRDMTIIQRAKYRIGPGLGRAQ